MHYNRGNASKLPYLYCLITRKLGNLMTPGNTKMICLETWLASGGEDWQMISPTGILEPTKCKVLQVVTIITGKANNPKYDSFLFNVFFRVLLLYQTEIPQRFPPTFRLSAFCGQSWFMVLFFSE